MLNSESNFKFMCRQRANKKKDYFHISDLRLDCTVELPMSYAEFDELNRLRFRKSIAAAGGISEGSVQIKVARIGTRRRRLLAESIRVDVTAYAEDENSASILVQRLTGIQHRI